jgi:hypothetical protein
LICELEPAEAARLVGADGGVVSGAAVIVTVEVADFELSACATAETVTEAGFGTLDGAVKSPEVEIVPWTESPPVFPFTCQFTPETFVFDTVAVNCCCLPVCTLALAGAIVTLMAGAIELLMQPAMERLRANIAADHPSRLGVSFEILKAQRLQDFAAFCVTFIGIVGLDLRSFSCLRR